MVVKKKSKSEDLFPLRLNIQLGLLYFDCDDQLLLTEHRHSSVL